MNSKSKTKLKEISSLLSLCLLFLNGCVSLMNIETGKYFGLEDAHRWTIGATTRDEFINYFGNKPLSANSKEINTSLIETFVYQYAKIKGKKIFMRLILAEFKDGILNGYIVESNMPGDYVTPNFALRYEIKNGVSSKEDVLHLLGTPMGKALFPTELDHPNLNEQDKMRMREVWHYAKIRADIVDWGMSETGVSMLSIGFNENGIVVGKQFESDLN